MKKFAIVAGALAALTFGSHAALADDCSGRSHDTGTIVGGVGGAAIGGLASHSVVGALAGGVLGGLAGNAIERSQDCNKSAEREDRAARRAYNDGYQDRAAEEAEATTVYPDRTVTSYPDRDVTIYRGPGDPYR